MLSPVGSAVGRFRRSGLAEGGESPRWAFRAERLGYSQRTLFALVHIGLLASLSTQFMLPASSLWHP